MAGQLSTRFNPKEFEPKWQQYWEKAGVFTAPGLNPDRAHCTVFLPPPNVTGILTLGHSLGGTCMDAFVRMQRMKGLPTLWLPGVDHAGLATQMAVRKNLEKNGVDVRKLTREEFLSEIDRWRVEKELHIRRQLTAHGFSLDWSRYVYTMGEDYQHAVATSFIRLFREGLVYRAEKMVNWDPKALTAISDLEVVPTAENGSLWFVRYPPAEPGDSPDGDGIVVATTRPETLFGDVAVAVNPTDARHAGLIGRKVRLPLTGRAIPVIADEAVDPAFGNGALKITPSHDFADLEIAKRHPELDPPLTILDERAHLTGDSVPGPLRGLLWSEARKRTVELLKQKGLLVKEEPYTHNVGYSERSHVPVEPRLSTQWFVDTGKMGAMALEAVRSGDVRIFPDRWTKTYYHFMENLQDWCISRQILWGHRIPVWYCDGCGHYDAQESPPAACGKCGGKALHQDPDVLDTWFSSWLWPFATLGWPGEGEDLAYYPGSVLITGSDIVFFWVARMIMGALKFTGKVPFPHVYLHGILVDKQGHKLSKSRGNSPDPLEFIDEWGADTFRFGLLFPNPVDQGGYWDYEHIIEGSRNFITKLWNIVRLLSSLVPEGTPAPQRPAARPANLFDRWLLSRLGRLETEVDAALAGYEFTKAASALHQFIWHEYADWYVEAQKERLKGALGEEARRESAQVALWAMDRALRMLHPIMPHVTEELWHVLPHEGEALATARWPTGSGIPDPDSEEAVGLLQEIVRGFRMLRKEAGWPESGRPEGTLSPTTGAARELLGSAEGPASVVGLAKLSSLSVKTGPGGPPGGVTTVVPGAELSLPRQGDGATRKDSLRKEQQTLEGLVSKSKARLADPAFRAKAPSAVVGEMEAKLAEMETRLQRIGELLAEGP